MEVPANFSDFLNFSPAANLVTKIILIAFFFLYLFFAFLLTRELTLMSSSIKTPLERHLKMLSYLNVFLAFLFFLAAIFLI